MNLKIKNSSKSIKFFLITGGAGYIGSNLTLELLKRGKNLIVIDNYSNSKINSLFKLKKKYKSKLLIFKTDLANFKDLCSIFKKFKIDTVFHLAAVKSISESLKKPNFYFINNYVGTMNIVKAMNLYHVTKLVFSSSATVYGNLNSPPFKENKVGKPTNPYGKTKLLSENFLRWTSSQKDNFLKVLVLRYFNPVGADISFKLGDFPKRFDDTLMTQLSKSIKNPKYFFSIYGKKYNTKDGTCVRDFIHVKDIVTGHIKAIKLFNRKKRFNIFNLGSGKGHSIMEVIKTFEKVINKKINYSFKSNRIGDVPISFANITKAKKILFWSPKYSLYDMCKSHWKIINK